MEEFLRKEPRLKLHYIKKHIVSCAFKCSNGTDGGVSSVVR